MCESDNLTTHKINNPLKGGHIVISVVISLAGAHAQRIHTSRKHMHTLRVLIDPAQCWKQLKKMSTVMVKVHVELKQFLL